MNNHKEKKNMENLAINRFTNLLILSATLCVGYVASLFLTYSFIVMPGLSIIDDQSFVAAFQGLESRFAFETSGYSNIPAMIAFPGSIILLLVLCFKCWKDSSWKFIFATLMLFILGMISTFIVNLPSNEFIYNNGILHTTYPSQIRTQFDEQAWTNWNHFRAFTTSVGVLLLIKAREIYSGK